MWYAECRIGSKLSLVGVFICEKRAGRNEGQSLIQVLKFIANSDGRSGNVRLTNDLFLIIRRAYQAIAFGWYIEMTL